MAPPLFYLCVKGTHTEQRSRTTRKHGKLENEEYTETIVDFDFRIDVGQSILDAGPVYYSSADNEPCFRGGMVRQTTMPWGKPRKSTRRENKAFKNWLRNNYLNGLPPWVSGPHAWKSLLPDEEQAHATLRSSPTIREWADQYTASDKIMKEFVFEKVSMLFTSRSTRSSA